MTAPWLRAEPIGTPRLQLEPLRVDHAAEAAAAFDDVALHTYIGGSPAGVEQLRSRYERQVVGQSADGSQIWLNWMLRRLDTGEVIGAVQATVSDTDEEGRSAEVAWVIATDHQGQGYAREAATAMGAWLREHQAGGLLAHVHPEHGASAGVARALGLRRTSIVVDGEERWGED